MEIEELIKLGEQYYSSREWKKAIEHYEKASKLGSVNAMYKLGRIYLYEIENYDKAREYFRKASELGYAEATLRLGAMYYWGHGVNKDKRTAHTFYVKALLQDNSLLNSKPIITKEIIEIILIEYNKLQNENELLKTQVLYQPGGEGYQEVKKHFNSLNNINK